MRTSLFALAIAILLSGCANPRYQTLYRYEPPADNEGRACLARCEPKLAACNAECKTTYEACVIRVAPEIEARYDEALKRYNIEFNHYRQELLNYELHRSISWGYYSPYDPFFAWPAPFYFQPIPPHPPSREQIQARVHQEKCPSDCGCQQTYDACFLSCGGQKIPETKCIAHCPEGKP